MASQSSRSDPEYWLLGKPECKLSFARLPRGLDVLNLVQFHHLNGKTNQECYKGACEAAIEIWKRAHIPNQRIDSCIRKLSKLHEQYLALKKNRKRANERDKMKEEMLKADLEGLFDIATKDAMMAIKEEEDKEFLRMQREDVFSYSMGSADQITAAKENRKRQREEKAIMKKIRYDEREQKITRAAATAELSSTSSSQESSNDEYQPPASMSVDVDTIFSQGKRSKNVFQDPRLVGALDRVNLPDRGAVFVAGAVAQALGHNISNFTMSRSSVRRSRRTGREALATNEKDKSLNGPFLLHWDGKLLPDIDGSKATVDRIAVLVTGNGDEKLLGIPKIERGTGEAQAKACLDTLEKWGISQQVQGLVFDTTASNTGLHKGTCIKIEKAFGRQLIWIACRHHIMEVVLSDVFSCVFGPTASPHTSIFKRFQKKWPSINQDSYDAATDELFCDPITRKLRLEMLEYLPHALKKQQPRDDYKEFLYLSLIFLGGGNKHEVSARQFFEVYCNLKFKSA